MFSTMLVMMFTGQRVFGAIGFVSAAAALLLWGDGAIEMPYTAAWKLFKWYPMLTLPLFIYMGFMISESGIANDLYKMFHVYFGGIKGGLAIGTMGMMVAISAMNGLSVAGMAIGATIALPEMLRRNYDKRMITGVVQAGSSLGILIPPSIMLVVMGPIMEIPVTDLFAAAIIPGILLALLYAGYTTLRCWQNPSLGPVLPEEMRATSMKQVWIEFFLGLVPPAALVFAALGSILFGFATPTEAAGCGAMGAMLLALAFLESILAICGVMSA